MSRTYFITLALTSCLFFSNLSNYTAAGATVHHLPTTFSMPTPSLPETEVPPSFSTCPDTDDSSRQRITDIVLPAQHPHTPNDVPEDDDASPRSDDTSSGPHFDNSDGPISDADVDASNSIRGGRAYNDSHKTIDVQIDRTESPCEPSPIESIATQKSRHGVGTNYTRDFNAPPTSRYSQRAGNEMEQDFALPRMGYGYPCRRVRFETSISQRK